MEVKYIMYGKRRFTPPINVGDEVEVTIEGVGEKGDGLAKVNGFIVFVPGTKENDRVKIRITKVFKKMGFGEVIGKAEGKPRERPRQKVTQEDMAPTIPEPQPEDSEDFGEDLEAKED